MYMLALWLLTLAAASITCAPYSEENDYNTLPIQTEKRAALVLDRLLVALKNALQTEPVADYADGPRAAALRDDLYYNDMLNKKKFQRRGNGGPTVQYRHNRCFFNPVTCF